MDPELAAAAALLRERGLVAASPVTAPIAEARAALDRISAFLAKGSEPLREEHTLTLPGGLRARLYRPDAAHAPVPLLVYAHGGSFAVGSLDGWDHVLRDIVRGSGCAALHLDYRLLPEHRFPAAHEDMVAGFRWAAANACEFGIDPGRLALGGDSAGANLALGAALALRDAGGPRPRFLLLHYGAYDTETDSASWQRFGQGAAGLSIASAEWLWANYLTDPAQRRDWRAAPLLADLRGLPPALLTIGTLDPLLDQNEALAARLAEAGIPCRLLRCEGLNHGFIRYGRLVSAVRRCLAESAAALGAALTKEPAHAA
ncbi:alpha/beta hydrolase [Paracraurococcus lichenis]|uniref:Alpha/beta hydrolase n=1 Tax=Paracraurococcus lichenis TaxID=3064888 RepID=A0ABT9DTA4_9PROT|nr:alpha/beta hydrolase [Paracraurococcus sp. LOR1-02]MDO9707131.1 alpha/beta hydrolase [Paracraurococcus sp. LOR1-02]